MSLTDKVIKNTFYHLSAQALGFIFPIILIPIIISKVGDVNYGILALVGGFIGTFSLFDLSISTSFVKFISENYYKHQYEELSKTTNTGFLFYCIFSLMFCLIGFLLADQLLTWVNIPTDSKEVSKFVFYISLFIFFIATSASVFVSFLTSLQKIYITSITGIVLNIFGFVSTIILLNLGYGLKGVITVQLCSVIISTIVNIYMVKKLVPELSFGFKFISVNSFKKMFGFGFKLQVPRISGFLADKYDEFLLAIFSSLNNVAYYNIANRVVRVGRFFPLQICTQAVSVAAELHAKDEKEKIINLFHQISKYLSIITLPLFVFLFTFSDLLVFCFMGESYLISSHLIKILCAGQVINIIFSAPGNAIIATTVSPKYIMNEGLINFFLNIILSYVFIKLYGIYGAAIGCTTSIIISSIYIFISSTKYFKLKISTVINKLFLTPFLSSGIIAFILFYINNYFLSAFINPAARIDNIILTLSLIIFYLLFYGLSLLKSKYITTADIQIFKSFARNYLPSRKS